MSRKEIIKQVEKTSIWDVIIIGGGATGLGIALDASSRGYKTLLIEQFDFGKGTSGKSTKLIHGGIRYLEQGNIGLVFKALKERNLLMKNARHICKPILFNIPVYNWFDRFYYFVGLLIYNILSGSFNFSKLAFRNKNYTLANVKGLNPKGLVGSFVFTDGQFDDTRLCINLAQTAVEHGACVINYAKVVSLVKNEGKVVGVNFEDIESGKTFSPIARVVINSTGVFVDDILRMDDPNTPEIIKSSQGVHIVIDSCFFPSKNALLIPKTEDGRVLFAIPWNGKVLLGTTDTPVDIPVIEPRPLTEEIDFILRHFNRYINAGLTVRDIKSAFAGLRPLVKVKNYRKTSLLPRDHTILVSKNKLVSVTGGKWTTYRKIAQETVSKACSVGNLHYSPCKTEKLPIHGDIKPGLFCDRLDIYGCDASGIRALQQEGHTALIHPRLPYSTAEILWIIRNEMVITVEDILSRRTRSLFLDALASIEASSLIASLMAKELNRSLEWEKDQVFSFTKTASFYLV